LGLKKLSHPRTAVAGNLMSALGMLIAVVVTLLDKRIVSFEIIIIGFIVGAAIGSVLAVKIKMTAMPQLVGLFNGLGGGASTLVAGAALMEFIARHGVDAHPTKLFTITTLLSGIIGAVTFWGSMVAFGKLQGLISEKAVSLPGNLALKIVSALSIAALGIWFIVHPTAAAYYWVLVGLASILGVFLVISIGGADMPVVIALLNSYSGLAAAATGFVLDNNLLIIAGSLVGASGIILTTIMCRAMNRSLLNVLFGGVGGVSAQDVDADDIYAGKVKSAGADEIALMLDGARKVVIVPGYGMAVAQAQHAVRDLMVLLESNDTQVDFAIHPVAGRMPGHMNVLLAEANVPYDRLKEMDEINASMEQVDIAIVIGANDVVNPMARTNPGSPIAGMPIIDVDKARTVIVIKRSLSPGFAGVPNPLFAADNTLMYFGDGKKNILDLISAIKEG
jgi:NAD(P) transhydrogenase subunit beta